VKAASVVVALEYRASNAERDCCPSAAPAGRGAGGFRPGEALAAGVRLPSAAARGATAAAWAGAAARACVQVQGCTRHSTVLPTARITATAAVAAQGSQGGAMRLPKTSEAAFLTSGPVMRWRSSE